MKSRPVYTQQLEQDQLSAFPTDPSVAMTQTNGIYAQQVVKSNLLDLCRLL